MFIIFGTSIRARRGAGGAFFCPNCRGQRLYVLVTLKRWFTLFFIPVIPLGDRPGFVECATCAGRFSERVLGLAPTDLAAPPPPNRVEPTYPAGWYPDPNGEAELRFYDGQAWTAQTRGTPPAITAG